VTTASEVVALKRFVQQRAISTPNRSSECCRKQASMSRKKPSSRRSFGSLRKLPSGKWQAAYRDQQGIAHRAPLTFDRKDQAEDYLTIIRSQILQGTWRDPMAGQQNFQDYFTRWLSNRTDLAVTTRELYGFIAAAFFPMKVDGRSLYDMKLRDISPQFVRDWYGTVTRTIQERNAAPLSFWTGEQAARKWAQKTGVPVPRTGRVPAAVMNAWRKASAPLMPKPRHGRDKVTGKVRTALAYRLLHGVLATAVKDELLERNPCRIEKGGEAKTEPRYVASIEQLLALAEAVPPRYRSAVLVGAWSGLRAGEQFALQVKHFNPIAGTVRVERSQQSNSGERMRYGKGKTEASLRTVVLPASIAQDLQRHIETFCPVVNGVPDPDALIFTSSTGMPVTGASRGSWWTRARREVGVPQLVWHGLRHTAQTIAAESGTDVATLMQRMGHSTIQATMVYLRSTPNGQQRLAQNLDKQTGLPTVIDLADYRKTGS
jgi:hypothetical protein